MATSREMTAGPALPLIFHFTMPLLLGNLLQQTYSLMDAAIVGKYLGINALASVGASSSVIFSDFRFLQRLQLRFRNSGGPEVWGQGLQHDAALCRCQPETFMDFFGGDSYRYCCILFRYTAYHADSGKYI